MADGDRLKYLRIALILPGVIFLAGIYPLMIIWPSRWTWHTGSTVPEAPSQPASILIDIREQWPRRQYAILQTERAAMLIAAGSGRAVRLSDEFCDVVGLVHSQRTAVCSAHLVDLLLLPGLKR
jgi:hypothetical protein